MSTREKKRKDAALPSIAVRLEILGRTKERKLEADTEKAWQSCPAIYSLCGTRADLWFYICFHKVEISKCSPSA